MKNTFYGNPLKTLPGIGQERGSQIHGPPAIFGTVFPATKTDPERLAT